MLRLVVRGRVAAVVAVRLVDDLPARVPERRDGRDVYDLGGARLATGREDALGAADVRLEHLVPALAAHADLVDRRAVDRRVAAVERRADGIRVQEIAARELAAELGQ